MATSVQRMSGSRTSRGILRVLLVEDSEDDAALIIRTLKVGGYDVRAFRTEDADTMRSALNDSSWDIVISDWSMPRFTAPGALEVLEQSGLDLPFIIASGTVGEDVAVNALHAGAGDFLLKDKLARLVPAVDRELREVAERVARRRAEEDLRTSEARHRELFEASPFPMWVYDTRTLAFLAVNEAAIIHYGYSREEFLSLTLADIRPSEDVIVLQKRMRERDATPDVVRHRKKDGTIILVDIRAHDLRFDNGTSRLVVATDVTERIRSQEALRKTEEQLRQAQKMEAVGRLAGSVAHDFNNVLSIVLGYAEMVLEGLKADDPIHSDMVEIRTAGERATAITKQLLLFSRQQAVEPRVLEVNKIVRGMENMLRRLLGADVELAVHLMATHNVLADKGHIEQVVMNLVINARDAMPDGGRISITTKHLLVRESERAENQDLRPGLYVVLAVADTGTGMDAATQARIFEPFFTTKEQGKGTGLGLSTVMAIVKQSRSVLRLNSQLGKGSTFEIYFPTTDDMSGPHTAPASNVTLQHGNETILLVEDDPQLRTVAREILRRTGYEVLEVPNGGEAILVCEQYPQPIDLILTDVVLPRMSGKQLVERLGTLRPSAKVLFMSGYTDDAIRKHGVLDSNVAFLQKPITPDSLLRKVRQVLGKPKDKK